jgi:hypothetical protein
VKEKAKTDLLVAFLGVLQVMALLTTDRRVKREGSHYRTPQATRRTAPQFLRASYAVPRLFRDLFVIVTCLNMYLNFC